MSNQTTILYLFISLLLAATAFSCTNNSTSVDENESENLNATIIGFSNSGAQAYLITSIEGEGAMADLSSANPELTLREGQRYTFINTAGASSHPLDFRDSDGEKLVGQSNNSGSFDSNDSINVVRNGDSISFTLTGELADELADYICSFHPGMNGSITISES